MTETLTPELRAILSKTGGADVQTLLSALSTAEERVEELERGYALQYDGLAFYQRRLALADKMAEAVRTYVNSRSNEAWHLLLDSEVAYRASEEKPVGTIETPVVPSAPKEGVDGPVPEKLDRRRA